jgi:hypothetical protein
MASQIARHPQRGGQAMAHDVPALSSAPESQYDFSTGYFKQKRHET